MFRKLRTFVILLVSVSVFICNAVSAVYGEDDPLAQIQPKVIYLNRLIGVPDSSAEGALYNAVLENTTKRSLASAGNLCIDKVGSEYSSSTDSIKNPGFKITTASWSCNLSNLKPAAIYQNAANSYCGRNTSDADAAPDEAFSADSIGIHASNFITYDIAQIRELGKWEENQVFEFNADLVQIHKNTGPTTYAAILLSNDEGLLGGYINNVWFDSTLNNAGDYVLNITEENPIPSPFTANSADASLPLYALIGGDADYVTLMISGYNGGNANAHFAFNNPTLTVIPEPATWALLVLGLCFGTLVRCKRRKVAA